MGVVCGFFSIARVVCLERHTTRAIDRIVRLRSPIYILHFGMLVWWLLHFTHDTGGGVDVAVITPPTLVYERLFFYTAVALYHGAFGGAAKA